MKGESEMNSRTLNLFLVYNLEFTQLRFLKLDIRLYY